VTPRFDPTLYAIVDLSGEGTGYSVDGVEEAILGGVTLLQVRGKDVAPRALWLASRNIIRLARRHGVPVIVNDRADVAIASGADGVHLGRDDVPAGLVRRIWPEGIIGASVHDSVERVEAEGGGADYLASGSLYPTGSKSDATPLDHELFRTLCRESTVPVVGIGGITVERAAAVAGLGAAGIAIIGGLWSATDTRRRAADYRAAFGPPRK
jgi:thiamine-phosphate pyrophosphorylase